MKDYRNAFILTLSTTAILAAGLVFVSWRYVLKRGAGTRPAPVPAPAAATSATTTEVGPPAPSAPEQAPLSPVQLSPQRLQSIGVTTAEVRMKALSNEVRAVGNVAVNERLQAYVQTRFSGWIQKVFADSTYQYVSKGQPLFTIYSPDLVATEQEYLLARKNRSLLAQSTVPGVAPGAQSLLTAAEERL